jgi:hypothetical protein
MIPLSSKFDGTAVTAASSRTVADATYFSRQRVMRRVPLGA